MARPHTTRTPDPSKAGRAHKCTRVALRPDVYAAARAALLAGESVPDLVGAAVIAEVRRRESVATSMTCENLFAIAGHDS